MGRKMKHQVREEDALQQVCVEMCRLLWPGVVVFHVPNGGGRSAPEGAILKKLGVLPGVADLVVLMPGATAGFIELKSMRGVQRESQREFALRVKALGFRYALCRTSREFEETMRGWMSEVPR